MSLKTFKPYTKSRRSTVLVDRSDLWKGKPFKSLTQKKRSSKGRNNMGRITARNSGGGHKKKYRLVDFFRKKTTRTIAGLSGRDASNDDRYLRDSVIVSVHTRNIGGESFQWQKINKKDLL